MHSIVIGTAGHIDHGKSSLVQALTGKNPDRLPEEKRRGITIDLGFADLDLGDLRVGFVDVPGHERFVKNMLAGAHGIDAVALVIAADEGVMPQTREHFDICRLLGVVHGLIVITKTDLVDEDMLSLVRAETSELVAGSFLENAPTVSVSAKTGAGLQELRNTMRQVAAETPARSADFVTRLPIDRVFTMKGFGAVVTGTLVSGEIAEGDEMELLPSGARVRVRGVQVHGAPVRSATAGQRTAVNLAGVELRAIERGMVLAEIGRLAPTQILDVQLTVLASAPRPLRTRARVRVHLGSAEVLGRIRVLNPSGEIAPGESAFAQLRLEAPVVAVHGERFIIRSYSPSITIAGGVVLDPLATKHRGRALEKIDRRLHELMRPERSRNLAAFILASGVQGLTLEQLRARTGLKDTVLSAAASDVERAGTITNANGVFINTADFEKLSNSVVEEVKSHHKRDPLSRGLARELLRERFFGHSAPEIFRAVMNQLEHKGVVVTEKDVVRLTEHSLDLSTADTTLRDKIAAIYQTAQLEPPTLDQALETAGVQAAQRPHARKILQMLLDSGTLVRVQAEMFLHVSALERLRLLLHDFASQHEPERLIDVSQFKTLAGVSRKYAIPLLEYLDSERITRRAGDKRIILK
ncbi:MAG TPA: selenocysteine-specific translation elongation factor [Pyrinomonadaceae bacterium]|nr:selenocysteine-specific translation elongation factor [Pyrinomonadaceae bacterium]